MENYGDSKLNSVSNQIIKLTVTVIQVNGHRISRMPLVGRARFFLQNQAQRI